MSWLDGLFGHRRLPDDEKARNKLLTSLLHAIEDDDEREFTNLLDEYPDLVSMSDYDLRSPLHLAASGGRYALAAELLKRKANPHALDRYKDKPIDWARRANHESLVKLLRKYERETGNELVTLCKTGDYMAVIKHLKKHPKDLRYSDYDSRCPLHLAATEGHLAIVRLLVVRGANVLAVDRWGKTALDDAKSKKCDEMVDFLQSALSSNETADAKVDDKEEADEEAEDNRLAMFLHVIEDDDLEEVIKTLDQHPGLVNRADYDLRSPLHLAASGGRYEIAKELLKRNANPHALDRYEDKPIDWARRANHDRVVKLLKMYERETGNKLVGLCQKGDCAAVKEHLKLHPKDCHYGDYDDRTPLHLATSEGHLEIVKLLVCQGANILAVDRWNKTPLDDANNGKFLEIVNYLESVLEERTREEQKVDLDELAKEIQFLDLIQQNSFAEVRDLLKQHPELANYQDYDKRSPLHIACTNGHIELVRLLLDHGANSSARDWQKNRPIRDAIREGHRDIKELLCDVDRKRGVFFIDLCREGNLFKVQRHLEVHPEDLNFCDYDKRSALHVAASVGNLEVVKLLVEEGANLRVYDKWDKTPRMSADDCGQTAVVEYLCGRGATGNDNPQGNNYSPEDEGEGDEEPAFMFL